MLRSLRQTTGSWVVKAFLGVVMLSFAVWGVGDILRGGGSKDLLIGDVDHVFEVDEPYDDYS